MYSASKIADPLGLTYQYKWADPAGGTGEQQRASRRSTSNGYTLLGGP